MSYGTDAIYTHRQAASYVNRILHGTKPEEPPVQAPNKFDLVINLKTAKALGLDVKEKRQPPKQRPGLCFPISPSLGKSSGVAAKLLPLLTYHADH
jgi:ABC-type uncharacterized transport system substrate-binding protein